MFLVNFLSRNDMGPFAPMFEIICAAELVLIVLTLISSCFVIFLVFKTSKLHRLVRFRLICGILMACMYVCSRVVIMHHQFFGTSEYAFSRVIASDHMQYGKGNLPRIHDISSFYAHIRSLGCDQSVGLVTFVSLAGVLILYADYITSIQSVYCFGALVLVGTVLFVLVYRRNLREIRELRRGAVINQYSISRTYQIKENISVLGSFTKLSRPMIIVCLPPMAFYPIFALVPQNIGYDGLRFFSVAMYDLWLAIASLTVISCVPYLFPHVMRTLNNLIFARRKRIGLAKPPIESMKKNNDEISDVYFNLLSADLSKGLNGRKPGGSARYSVSRSFTHDFDC